MLSDNVKVKPAFKSVMDNPQGDFKGATDYGSMWVGEKALYLYDFDVIYIPLEELDSVRLEIQEDTSLGACCCNRVSFTPHDVYIKTTKGETLATKVLNPKKAQAALGRISELNSSVHCTVA